jgi:hypothetical protein
LILNFDFPHGLLIALLKLAVESQVLIDRQGFPLGVTGDELQLGVGHVRRGPDAGRLGVALDDLLDAPCRERAAQAGLEQLAILRMGCQGAQGRGEGLAEQNDPILAPLPLVDPDAAGFQVDVSNLDAAQLSDPHAGRTAAAALKQGPDQAALI